MVSHGREVCPSGAAVISLFSQNAASPNFRYWLTHLWAARKRRFALAATSRSERRSSKCGWMRRNRDIARSRAASDTPLSSCMQGLYAKYRRNNTPNNSESDTLSFGPTAHQNGETTGVGLAENQQTLCRMVLDTLPSSNSRRNYGKALDDLFAFAGGRRLTRGLLMEYRSSMEALATSTIKVRLSAMRRMDMEARKRECYETLGSLRKALWLSAGAVPESRRAVGDDDRPR